MGQFIDLTAADGQKIPAYVAKPEGQPKGAVVVVQEIFGVNAHIRAVTDRLAMRGYLAVAPSTFARVQKGVDLGYSDADMKAYTDLLTHADLLKLPQAGDLLWMYVNHKAEQTRIEKDDYHARAALLPTPALREAYLFREAQLLRYYEQLAKLQELMGTQPSSQAFEQGLEPIKAKLAWSKPGQQALDFEGLCPDGSRLKLSDLRGKLVVVDVWATWCVPCLRMMPLFKQLEEELQDPRLAFMSVCLGVSVEEDRWRKIIADNHLEGNLIFIDSWTKGFAKDYRVTGVPRFLIIGPDGNVISYSAPAPTHPELKQMIVEQLAKMAQ